MSNQQALEEAIRKAMSRGWDMYDHDKWSWGVINKPGKTEASHYFVRAWIGDLQHFIDVYYILLDHDFAKALWGESQHTETLKVPVDNGNMIITLVVDRGAEWIYHLQQMAIADDLIKYLWENL